MVLEFEHMVMYPTTELYLQYSLTLFSVYS